MINHSGINIGMTKSELIQKYGGPTSWSRKIINEHIYEILYYYDVSETFDFVDNILTGYSSRSRYITKDGIEDIRDYPSK
jgi:hypothetical protein